MKTRRCIRGMYFAFLFDLIFSTWMPALSETQPGPRNVVIVILNSIRYSDAFGDKRHLYIENIWKQIKPLGTLCEKVYNNGTTVPLPAQSLLLTGVSPNAAGAGHEPSNPTLFEYFRKQTGEPKEKVLFAVSSDSTAILACSNQGDYGKAYAPEILTADTGKGGENDVCKKASAYIKDHHPSLVVLSLSTGKSVKHHISDKECQALSRGLKDACGTPELLNSYYEGIIVNDLVIAELWRNLQSDDFYKDNTVFLIVSSQGRHTGDYSSYGDRCEGCTRLLFLIAGPGIRKNFVSGRKRYLTDVVPTIGKLLGIKTERPGGNIMNEIMSGQ